jgi:hypothetical protein
MHFIGSLDGFTESGNKYFHDWCADHTTLMSSASSAMIDMQISVQ